MRILLIQPNNENAVVSSASSAPLWPGILKSLTPENHEVDFIQCSFEKITEETLKKYDLVALSVWTHTSKKAYEIGDLCKKLGVKCVMGGIHVFVLPQEALQHSDTVILGEAEGVWTQVLTDAEQKKLKQVYRGSLTKPEAMPCPDKSITKKYKYLIENVVETVRGCPFNCDFCSATLYSGREFRYKPVEKIAREIESWKNKGRLSFFVDVNVVSSFPKAKELFRAIKPFNLNWWGDASVNVADDPELLKLLGEAGCNYLVLGLESISKNTLQSVNKTQNLSKDYRQVVKKLHEHNIDVVGAFIFGFDSDNKNVFQDTVDFAFDADIDFPVFGILTPYPGTKVFERLNQEKRITSFDWSKYTRTNVVFKPKQLTEQELLDGFLYAMDETTSSKKIFKTLFGRWRGSLRRHLTNALLDLSNKKQAKALKATA